MGYYDSGMSAWERRRLGLENDHIGPGVVGETEDIAPQEATQEVVEVEPPKKVSKKTPKKTA